MRRIRVTLEIEDEDGVAAFSRESREEEQFDELLEKQQIGILLAEVLLAMEAHVVGGYALTCLPEALVFADSTNGDLCGMEALVQAASAFLRDERDRLAALRGQCSSRE